MRLKWFIIFFLLGLIGTVLLTISSIPKSTMEPPAAMDPSRIVRPSPLATPSKLPEKVVAAEKAITNSLNQLPKGEIYHNVPEKMKVGVSDTIEAGIAPQVTERIKKEIQGKGNINVESGVRFDPSGMEMKVVVQNDEFKVFEVKGGEQFVTASTPGRWIWQVTPLKAGDNLIVVKAIVKLNVPELKITRSVEVEVFRATRQVQVNPAYSASQFIASNWKEVVGLIIGPGSLVGGITWWIVSRNKKKTEEVSVEQKKLQELSEIEELREFKDRLERWRTSEISDEQLKLFIEGMQMEKAKLFRYISNGEIDVSKDDLRQLMEKNILLISSKLVDSN